MKLALSAIFVFLVAAFLSQGTSEGKVNPGNEMKRVTGIGGIFFKSDNPKLMREWYGKHLGLQINEYGSLFEWRSVDDPNARGYTQWSPFSKKTKYFMPSEKEFMINYRVENLEALIPMLKAEGVDVVDTIMAYDYGKFAHIMDPDGNKIELWEPEPGDTTFSRLYEGKTTH